jgi:uncharacterized DUF497 family protein
VFEFDAAKSATNKAKHGIDFFEAQALWLDDDFVEIPTRSEREHRFIVIGRIAGVHWTAVVTIRERRVRLISARRARRKEVAFYESRGL